MDYMGRIVALVSCLLCSFPFFVIGIYNKDSKEPISFWTGDTTIKAVIKNVRGYNTEIAGLYKRCGLFFLTYRNFIFIISYCRNCFTSI